MNEIDGFPSFSLYINDLVYYLDSRSVIIASFPVTTEIEGYEILFNS